MTTTPPQRPAPAKKIAAVTGASGFIGSHIVKLLLQRGYHVRGTVRNLKRGSNADFLHALEGAGERLTLYEANLFHECSFDSAFDGSEYVFHTAFPQLPLSPGKSSEEDWATVIEPAVMATRNVLASVNRCPSVTRMVFTSSVSACKHFANDKNADHVYSEVDWNELCSANQNPYSYSKTLAEWIAWDESRKQTRWSLVTVLPGLVVGPVLSPCPTSSSVLLIKRLLTGDFPFAPQLDWALVDVRSVAEAHLLAAEQASAVGRFLAISEVGDLLTLADCLRGKGAYPLPKWYIPKWLLYIVGPGTFGLTAHYIRHNVGIRVRYSNLKIRTILGVQFIPIRQSMADMLESFITHGLVSRK